MCKILLPLIFGGLLLAIPLRADRFNELPISQVDQEKIVKLIHRIAQDSYPRLYLKQDELEKIRQEINHVHPLRFLWSIFSSSQGKRDMQAIHASYLKWRRFLHGLCPRMQYEAQHNNLADFIDGFAASLGADSAEVHRHIETHDYEGLVRYLMK